MKKGVASHEVFIGSTGVIGRTLPVDRIVKALPALFDQLSTRGGAQAARAILTTDLRPKSVVRRARISGRTVTIGGMAKGSGMIHPDMATMLGYLTTDASITRTALQRALLEAADASFNCISVDGDTSTNDTVLCLANGMAGNRQIREGTPPFRRFVALLTEVCEPLALAICRDGEGVTKVVKIEVTGAASLGQARAVARTIGTSNLVKTALFGEDANWGRIMDMTMVDVTDLPPVHVGDTVTLIGRQGQEAILADEIARWSGTIPYETLCGIGPRILRVYQGS